MKRVLKYPIPVQATFSLQLPVDAPLLSVQVQRDQPQLWVLVDQGGGAPTVRKFMIVATGEMFDGIGGSAMFYVGTFQLEGGALVFHLFEVKPESLADDPRLIGT